MTKEEYMVIRKNFERKEGKVYSIPELTKIIKCSRTSIYNWIRNLNIELLTIKLTDDTAKFPTLVLREKDAMRLIIENGSAVSFIKWLCDIGYGETNMYELLDFINDKGFN